MSHAMSTPARIATTTTTGTSHHPRREVGTPIGPLSAESSGIVPRADMGAVM